VKDLSYQDFEGIIIEESLCTPDVLREVSIISTKVEDVTEEHKTPWLSRWTLHQIYIPKGKADKVAKILSECFDPAHPEWYSDFKNYTTHYIIYQNKIFKVDRTKPEQYKEAADYGISLGILEYQLDFSPNI
jgi:hypothetical protein